MKPKAIWRPNKFNLHHYALVACGLLLLAGGIALFAPPSVGVTPGKGLTLEGVNPLTVNASGNVTGVQYQVDGVNIGSQVTTAPFSYSWDSRSVLNGQHTISAVATNLAGIAATSTSVVTVANPDVTPPTAPSDLGVSGIGTNLLLSWAGSTDEKGGSGLAAYRVFSNGKLVATIPRGTTKLVRYSLIRLRRGTTYSFLVTAVDEAGNVSPPSNTISITTKR